MAGRRNDSNQMKEVFQHQNHSEKYPEDRCEHQHHKQESHRDECSRQTTSHSSACSYLSPQHSSPGPSSSSPTSSGAASCRCTERNDPVWPQKDEPSSSQRDDSPRSQRDEPPWTQRDEPPWTLKDDPPWTLKDDPPRTLKDDPPWTLKDDPPWTLKDDPPRTLKDDPPQTQRDDPPRTHRDDPRWSQIDDPTRTQREDSRSSCCPLRDLKRHHQCGNKLGPLKFSSSHTVLIDVEIFNSGIGLIPKQGVDSWLSNFVKMPCSQSNAITVKAKFPQQSTRVTRWDEISKHLRKLAKKTKVNVNDVEDTIIKYNPKYKDQWSFDALSTFVKRDSENDFGTLFPKIAALALKLPDNVKTGIPLLQSGHSAAITLSQTQIACLLANAFFCTFPHRNDTSSNAEYRNYPTINFTSLFGNWTERKKEKLRAIMHYFKVVTDENTKLNGLVTFERRCLGAMDVQNWKWCKKTMPKLYVSSHGTIEDEGTGMLQVDFASRWIGGGVLGSGLVQEEILFLINPELIVSRLFTEKLDDNECLIITGPQQFSRYSGFSDSFKWVAPHEDKLERDEWARKQRQILAIDALHFKHRREQYNMRSVTRELNKAYCGFKGHENHEPDIATGKWGCGAFNGDPQLKAVIQLMAAAKATRGLAFFTFKDEKLKRDLERVYHLLVTEGTTVEKLYGVLEDFCAVCRVGGSHVDLFEFISNTLKHSRSQL